MLFIDVSIQRLLTLRLAIAPLPLMLPVGAGAADLYFLKGALPVLLPEPPA